MTNRIPEMSEFNRKFLDYSRCLNNYFYQSSLTQLAEDQALPDIDLVCKYELQELRNYVRSQGLGYESIYRMPPNLPESE